MRSQARRVVVLGGAGFVGHSVCAQWISSIPGAQVLVPSRQLRAAADLRLLPGVELPQVQWDNGDGLNACLAGADTVVNLVAILHGSQEQFEQVHVQWLKRVVSACQSQGVKRLIHISALGVGAQAPSRYLRSKFAGEEVVRKSDLQWTVLRPSVIFGARDRFLNLFASMQSVLPIVPLAGADALFQPVWVEDVAQAVIRCAQRADTVGATIECAGPEVVTLADLVRLAGRYSGHRRPILPLGSGLLARLQATLMAWAPGPTLMSPDNVDSMQVPNVASGQWPGLDALGIQPAWLDQVVPTYLSDATYRPWGRRRTSATAR